MKKALLFVLLTVGCYKGQLNCYVWQTLQPCDPTQLSEPGISRICACVQNVPDVNYSVRKGR